MKETLKDATLKQYLCDLSRRLDPIMTAVPQREPGNKLHQRMRANRAHPFVFMTIELCLTPTTSPNHIGAPA
jgi:hypothetical protein